MPAVAIKNIASSHSFPCIHFTCIASILQHLLYFFLRFRQQPNDSGRNLFSLSLPPLICDYKKDTRPSSPSGSRATLPQHLAVTIVASLVPDREPPSNLATRHSPRLQRRGMENEHLANGEALANGHAIIGETLQKMDSNIQKQENIFLFIPNLIGKPSPAVEVHQSDPFRLRSHFPRHILPLLHATAPAHVLLLVQSIMHSRCSGWIRRTILQPVNDVRRSP
jgi:hypothetical protein